MYNIIIYLIMNNNKNNSIIHLYTSQSNPKLKKYALMHIMYYNIHTFIPKHGVTNVFTFKMKSSTICNVTFCILKNFFTHGEKLKMLHKS